MEKKKILSNISPQARAAFLSALVCGLAAHGMALTNKFSTHDDILALFWTGSTIASGRWMLHVIGWMETLLFGDGHFSLPMMNGLFSLCCVGLAAAWITNLLKIRRRSYAVGLGGVMAAFPAMLHMSPEERERTRRNLLKYCELDTLAMVKIWEKLREVVA